MPETIQDLDKKIVEEHYNRLLRTHSAHKYLQLSFLWELLHTNPVFSALCQDINNAAGARFDFNAFAIVGSKKKIPMDIYSNANDRILVSYKILMQIIIIGKSQPDLIYKVAALYEEDEYWTDESRFALFNDLFLEPVIFYLFSNLNKKIIILNHLNKYKQKSEWFNKSRLFDFTKTDSKDLEGRLTSDLYSYLFDKGFDFSVEPTSPSGILDFLASQKHAPNKYLIEGKVFDAVSRSKEYICKGIRQTLFYLNDYNESIGYLVIYKTTDKSLVFNMDISDDGIPIYKQGHKTIYFLLVDIHPYDLPASKRKKTDAVVINYNDILNTSEFAPE
jgi:hypothetical protein